MLTVMSSHGVPDWVRFLVRAGQQAPSADNSQPWHFVWDGKCLSVHLDPVRRCRVGARPSGKSDGDRCRHRESGAGRGSLGVALEALKVGCRATHEPFASVVGRPGTISRQRS
ncbi:MAG: hypothetical protein IPG28_11430 [Betaproteobacteria bacterium]|nr:hypothetical protein [Betaproteobacteria bacterium]